MAGPPGPPWRWAWRRGRGPGRPPKPRTIWFPWRNVVFEPIAPDGSRLGGEPVVLNPDELEALRLVYYEGLSQEEAAKRMNISRGTFWRILDSGRRKLVQALVELRPIVVAAP